jgi:hypothetical protein
LLLFAAGLLVGRWWEGEAAGGGPGERVAASADAPRSTAPAEYEAIGSDIAAAVDSPAGGLAPDRPVYVALVIDDLGRSLDDVEALRELDIDLTYAVLPFEARTAEVVSRLQRSGVEILVHLPMEPGGTANPGPGALLRGMGDAELARRTVAALDAVPGAVGVNNHMGSALSADLRAMDVILEQLRDRELFYLDSRTSAVSVGFDLARGSGMAAVRRDVFLDGELEPAAIRGQFYRLLEIAREQGAAVAIGHPHSETLAILREEVPRALALGYRFVPVSYLLERTGGE